MMNMSLKSTNGSCAIRRIALMIMSLALALTAISCAPPALYNVTVEYAAPPEAAGKPEASKNLTITVAKFNDLRNVEDTMVIGSVSQAGERPIPILPRFHMPSISVTRAVKDYLYSQKYIVAKGAPDWNLNSDTIAQEWGDMVIGGNIRAFELICSKERPIIKYKARVSLTAVFADVAKKEILFSVNVESSPSLDHVRFTEGKMAEVINDALAAAVNQIFENEQVSRRMREMAKGK
ncbi:MAG: hypothetical protein JW736_05740 [Deltaproteobacteria bacterium]|nr:hypothetical protein [Deltaproteobacteria bacterium]MBN2688301.1 hypothetical protein [Deltaproteobacteria bacterium]